MPEAVVAAKIHVPRSGRELVPRPRLMERVNAGLRCRLTLISAPAGFGKTTLASEWVAACGRPAAWLSLDEGDNDPARFLFYLLAALGTISPSIREAASPALQSPRPQPTESILAALLDEIAGVTDDFLLVLDDYHLIDAAPVDTALTFVLDHLPPRMHLAIVTREDPDLPLARLRARGQLAELRAADLRFSPDEAAEFLNSTMCLDLSAGDVAALEARTEGWIAGLHLAAISLQGRDDPGDFIRSFSGSNSFVMDFLIEEVLRRQPRAVQEFLVQTSILDRLSGPLCDAVLRSPAAPGQETLEHLERANLFLVPLDSDRRWYRYHHLFRDLLRQQRGRFTTPNAAELHTRASRWYEDNGMEIEAFRHAVAANDLDRAELLVEGNGKPLYFRGAIAVVLQWLESLPADALDARPSLWVMFASTLMLSARPSGVEDKLRAAEAALQGAAQDAMARHLEGRIAVLRAMVAAAGNALQPIRDQTRRALELLSQEDHAFRVFNELAQGYASLLEGDSAAGVRTFTGVMAAAQASGSSTLAVAAASSLGQVQESELQLRPAAATYRHILRIIGDPSHMYNYEAHLGLGRILYEWNDLEAALHHAEQSAHLAPLIECMCPSTSLVLLARVRLALQDAAGAAALLERAAEAARLQGAGHAMPEVAAAQVTGLLLQGSVAEAARLARKSGHPESRARVHLAQGNPAAALAVLDQLRLRAEARGSGLEVLKLTVLQALAFAAKGETEKAVQLLGSALALAEPGGFIRLFVDEGAPMAALLSAAAAQGVGARYADRLLAEFSAAVSSSPASPPALLAAALSQREVEVLTLIAQGCTNQEIAERLFLALSTVKGHNQSIFGKLQVQRRTEAIARARELGLV